MAGKGDGEFNLPNDYRGRLYAQYVSGYLAHSRGQITRQLIDRSLRQYDNWFGPYLPSNPLAPILDVGCGYGNFLYWAGNRGFRYLAGIDISEEQVALARQLCPAATILCADWRIYLQDKVAVYRLISCLDVVEHMTRDELLEFLDAAHRALLPGGSLLLQTVNGEGLTAGTYIYGDLTHETILTPVSIKTVLRVCGFENPVCKPTLPIAKNLQGVVRLALWKGISLGIGLLNLIEVGNRGSGIVTRNMIVTAQRSL